MKVLVTGGTGLLGNTVLRQLQRLGCAAMALVRSDPSDEVFRGLDVEFVHGDLSDEKVIDQAVARADAVIHSAGLIHIGWQRHDESLRVNRDGTRVIADAALRHDRRLVHVGTVNTLAVGTRNQPANETTPLTDATRQVPCSYVVSKQAGVAEVLAAVERGLRATIVHPGFMLGPWDWKPSSGRMLIELQRVWRPVCPAGGCSLCDSRDVASATIAAIDEGGYDGDQYILAGENISYFDLWTEISRRVGRRGPVMPVGPLMRVAAGRGGDLWAKLSDRESDINSAAIGMSTQYSYHDSSRARIELGYQNRPASETLDDAVAWMRDRQTQQKIDRSGD